MNSVSVNFVLGVLSKYKDSLSMHTYIINSILGGMPHQGSVHIIIIVNSCVTEREGGREREGERETKGEIQTHRNNEINDWLLLMP